MKSEVLKSFRNSAFFVLFEINIFVCSQSSVLFFFLLSFLLLFILSFSLISSHFFSSLFISSSPLSSLFLSSFLFSSPFLSSLFLSSLLHFLSLFSLSSVFLSFLILSSFPLSFPLLLLFFLGCNMYSSSVDLWSVGCILAGILYYVKSDIPFFYNTFYIYFISVFSSCVLTLLYCSLNFLKSLLQHISHPFLLPFFLSSTFFILFFLPSLHIYSSFFHFFPTHLYSCFCLLFCIFLLLFFYIFLAYTVWY